MKTIVHILLFMLFVGCAAATLEEKKPPAELPEKAEKKGQYIPTESEKKSLEVFNEILKTTRSSLDRKSLLPKLEKQYLNIIEEYPDAPLAQESHYRLITLYIDDYSPSRFRKAESLYKDFVKKYPHSTFKGLIQDTLGKGYHRALKWDKMLELSTPAFNTYVEEGKRPRPSLIYYYAEAHYKLGNPEEAEKGYRILLDLYPKLIEGINAKKRLEEIKSKNKSLP
jgi:TolA-binding protein